jgi:BirA family biotin operon repressor/biotin-[acetyl-CoA-carboxylase] ligase
MIECDDDALLAVVSRHQWVTSLIYKDSLSSTNDVAQEICQTRGLGHGTLVLANWQQSGKGRFNNAWDSPKGQDILMSLVIEPRVPAYRWPCVQVPLSMAIRSAVSSMMPSHMNVQLKWPNDLLVNGKKCAGVLSEGLMDKGLLICGIGINVNQHPVATDGRTSMALALGHGIERWQVLDAVLHYIHLQLHGIQHAEWCPDEWHATAAYVGEMVTFTHKATIQGRFIGLGPNGGAQVQTSDGVSEYTNAQGFRRVLGT